MKKLCILVMKFVFVLSFGFAEGSQEGGAADDQMYLFKYAHTQSDNHP